MPTGQTQHLKKRLFLLKAGKACPLTAPDAATDKPTSGFNSVVVYSFLVYRLKMAHGDQDKAAVTNKQIQRGTGQCRSRTIPKAIDMLEAHGLAGRVNNRVFARQGQSNGWFVQITNSHHRPWYARFAYFPIWIPCSNQGRLTPRQNALYWLIAAKPRQKQIYYSLCLGIDAKTVTRAVRKLRVLELLSWSGLEPRELTAEHMELWQDRAQHKLKSNEFQLSRTGVFTRIDASGHFVWFIGDATANQTPYEQFCDRLDETGNRMRSAGYSTVEIAAYWDDLAQHIMRSTNSMEPLELFILDFANIFAHVEAVTNRNRAAGQFAGANSLGLLKSVTRQVVQELQIVWENRRLYGGLCIWSWTPKA